jgi:hypothetical protein
MSCYSCDTASAMFSNQSASSFLLQYESLSGRIQASLFAVGSLGRHTCFKSCLKFVRLCCVFQLSLALSAKLKDRFSEELEQVFNKFPKYHMKILLGNFHAKVGREDIFKPTIGNES